MPVSEATLALRDKLRLEPHDDALRERVARALHEEGELAEALRELAPLVNLTAHDDDVLPCLCREHLGAAPLAASVEGVGFRRSFTIGGGRVLHYWIPDELAGDEGELSRSVRVGLLRRLGLSGRERRDPRTMLPIVKRRRKPKAW
jgi:hypothetical protein